MIKPHVSGRLQSSVIIVLWGWMLAGVSLLLSPLFNVHEVNPALIGADNWVKLVIALLLILGSCSILLSGKAWKKSTTSWKYELVGLPLLIAGWGFYTTSIFVLNGLTLFPIFLGIGHMLAGVARLRSLVSEKTEARMNVEILIERVPDVG